jgi:oleate hydratase
MKAHIVGGGFGGLAAAGYLIKHAGMAGPDIIIYEADAEMGGSFSLGGGPQSGYILPSGSVFDAEFRCTFALLKDVRSKEKPELSVTDHFFQFNAENPFNNQGRLLDRNGKKVHGPRFGLSLGDGLDLAKLALKSEEKLEGRRIEEFFSPSFFKTEFWLMYSTIMGSLPQHSATELRRYLNRTLHLFPSLSDMAKILRTPINQNQAFVVPLVEWLQGKGVNLKNRVYVRDVGFAPTPGITVNRLDIEQNGAVTSIAVAPDDIVLLTFGSQAADLSIGSMHQAPVPQTAGRSWKIWEKLAQGNKAFGNPGAFFGKPQHIKDSRWVSFTVTTKGKEFINALEKLTGSKTGYGGLVSLIDSKWMVSLSVFLQPEMLHQPEDTYVWWGYGLFPQETGEFVKKNMDACTGAEILEEVLRHMRLGPDIDKIMASSICIPCDLPYCNNIWLPRTGTDRPPPVPEGSTNLGLFGQYVEVPKDVAFTIEYSARCAWEAIHVLTRRGPAPPPVFQAQFSLKALWGALKVFVLPWGARP